jgi:hypothetical protein
VLLAAGCRSASWLALRGDAVCHHSLLCNLSCFLGVFGLCNSCTNGAQAQVEAVPADAAVSRAWAWPLPQAGAAALARYEALARELVLRHGKGGARTLRSVRLASAAAEAHTLVRFELDVQHARALNESTTPGGLLPR